uniref:Synaptogyrin 1b n=1 Tax=Neogobius melanostomus TaxID=47308 RepID=A0A8C6TJA6_9GOBI
MLFPFGCVSVHTIDSVNGVHTGAKAGQIGHYGGLTFCRPQLFSVVIFGCIANEGYINRPTEEQEYCIFNQNAHACNYAVSMGCVCFLCCSGLLALDVRFPQISGVKDRKKAVLADLGVSEVHA